MNRPKLGAATLAMALALTALSAPAETGGAFLGVAVRPAGPTLTRQLRLPPGLGLLVERVAIGSPADLAGIRAHDVLLHLDEQLLFVPAQLEGLLRNLSTETPVTVDLVRARERRTLTLKLAPTQGTLPDSSPLRVTVVRAPSGLASPQLADWIETTANLPPPDTNESLPLSAYLGLRLGYVPPSVLAHLPPGYPGGAVVLEVAADSPAEAASLEPHDIIVELDGQPILDPRDLFEKLRNLRSPAQPELTVLREGQVLELPVRLGNPANEALLYPDRIVTSDQYRLPAFEIATDAEWMILVKPLLTDGASAPANSASASPPTVIIEGATMTIRLEGDPGNRKATIIDSQGSVLFRGGITTEADRLQMPRHIWARVAELLDPDDLSPRAAPQLESDQLWERRASPDWL